MGLLRIVEEGRIFCEVARRNHGLRRAALATEAA